MHTSYTYITLIHLNTTRVFNLYVTGDVRPIYESLCHSLTVNVHGGRMEEGEIEDGHLVTNECGHWTVCIGCLYWQAR